MLLHLAFLSFSIPAALACMPGYDDERQRLREHLGIEWIPRGLEKSGASVISLGTPFFERSAVGDRPIRRPQDLNWNFAEPETCRWKNMEPNRNMDTLDFHLFEKIDWTEFPALQVRPGPSKVSQGERMILTGDKICLGSINLNTECHAEIPPRETPFRLGIRAYDMANKDGSFVIVDDVMYSASLCKVGVDLGENFVSEPLITSATGKDIEIARQLDCNDFDKKCRWRSGGQSAHMWQKSSTVLPRDFIFSATGSYVGPSGSYSLLYIEQDTPGPLDALKSDPIPCQSQTENTLTFRWWATRGVQLEVCAVPIDETNKKAECIAVASVTAPAPAKISFKQAANNFVVRLLTNSKSSRFPSASYDGAKITTVLATLCSDALSAFDLGEHFIQTPMLSILLHRSINSAEELSCDFSKRAADCAWGSSEYNVEEDSELLPSAWLIGQGPLNVEKLYSLSGQATAPDGEFAVAKFETGGSSLLLSEVVRCVLDDVSISFNMWSTGSATLQVCLVEESSPLLLDCQSAQSGPVVVDLPPISKPFRIALRADADDQGMIIVDNIEVQGSVCPALVRHPTADEPDPNVCRLLSCNFSGGHACLYEKETIPGSAPFKGSAALFVCNDSAKKELESCFKVEGDAGDDFIELLPSDTKVYLIGRLAENAVHSGSLHISKLTLTDTIDNEAC